MKSWQQFSVSALLGTLIGLLSRLFGGLDTLLYGVVLVLVLDVFTGVGAAALTGTLSSSKGWKGLLRKAMVLFAVALGAGTDAILHLDGLLRNTLCLFYIGNEALSILENLERAGVPFPTSVRRFFEKMQKTPEEAVSSSGDHQTAAAIGEYADQKSKAETGEKAQTDKMKNA